MQWRALRQTLTYTIQPRTTHSHTGLPALLVAWLYHPPRCLFPRIGLACSLTYVVYPGFAQDCVRPHALSLSLLSPTSTVDGSDRQRRRGLCQLTWLDGFRGGQSLLAGRSEIFLFVGLIFRNAKSWKEGKKAPSRTSLASLKWTEHKLALYRILFLKPTTLSFAAFR